MIGHVAETSFPFPLSKNNFDKPVFGAQRQLSQLKDIRYSVEDGNVGGPYTGQQYCFGAQSQHLLKTEPLPDSYKKKGSRWRQALFSLPHPSVINAWLC